MENKDEIEKLHEASLKLNKEVKEKLAKAEAEGQKVPESVWADGIPDKVDEKDKIPQDELMSMAVDYIMTNVIIPKGFKIEPGFPRPQYPNIICKRDGLKYSIVIVPCLYPAFITIDDKSRLEFVKTCKQNDLIPLYAAVGYRSYDEERAKARLLLRGDIFITTFPGFIVLGDKETQNFDIKTTEMFRP
ncbi:MAG: hypothetical protein IJP63_01580 [Acholeplasmatales bacterium]|nr:hypothetical protein [Acholeplasmatales bacterium]